MVNKALSDKVCVVKKLDLEPGVVPTSTHVGNCLFASTTNK